MATIEEIIQSLIGIEEQLDIEDNDALAEDLRAVIRDLDEHVSVSTDYFE